MVLNENLGQEVKEAITKKTTTYAIAKKMGVQTSQLFKIYNRDLVKGQWVDALELAGYDVEIVIKPKK